MSHPIRRPEQSLCAHKREMADWMECGSVETMDALHDKVHEAMCAWIGIPSYAMKQARGEPLSPTEQRLADMEEDAALAVQRFIHNCGKSVP